MGVGTVAVPLFYIGNNTTGTYAYPFYILPLTAPGVASDLLVTVYDASGKETVLTEGTHYTVTGQGNSAGGNVVLTNGAFAWIGLTGGSPNGFLATGYTLSVRRYPAETQKTDIRNQGPYFPANVEDAFDKLTMIAQTFQDVLNRALKLSRFETGGDTFALPIAATRASKFLAFDTLGNPVALAGVPAIPVAAFATPVKVTSAATIVAPQPWTFADPTLGGFNLSLPAAAGNGGFEFVIVNTGTANSVGFVLAGADTFNGATAPSLAPGDWVGLVSDNVSKWYITRMG